ncbi:hypothetical protein [Pseudorhodobacter sp.]|uniref:hypothetical protein n=1 Tax=Pseudorhodobacter sp. TaxID=1934400 RepID=UPI002649D434|nr:hypothetical protein [Pseudorhodobacter sp.]MDN5787742.1 hypothetical protein [Pseudorhodobacter sp.]
MNRRIALLTAIAIPCAMPALAGYVDKLAPTSPVYQAAEQVAKDGCTITAADWTALVVSLDGTDSDGIFHLSKMNDAGDVEIDSATQSFTLKGVFGC